MLQPRGHANLALKPLGAEAGSEFRMQHLERNRTPVPKILGEKDRSHAAAPELALDCVGTKTDSKLLA
jgi:hypothetical protein